jgi:PKD repeat protein
MTLSYSIPGESETLDVKDVWILAPNIGKLRIAVMDELLIQRGWLDLTGGTVGGNNVIDIMKPIVADFEADLVDGFSPLTVQFTDLSSGLIDSWYWDFGDDTGSSSQNPQHVFSSPGTYTVRLTVTGLNGSDTESKARYINVKEIKAMPWIPLLLLDD